MFSNDRNSYRKTFFAAWEKYQKKLTLDPVEAQLIEIMLQHPEYHDLLDHPDVYQHQEFTLQENPFFHMSLHLALREQIQTNRPPGVSAVYQSLIAKHEDQMIVEHLMMECLAHIIWNAQQDGKLASEEEYLRLLREL